MLALVLLGWQLGLPGRSSDKPLLEGAAVLFLPAGMLMLVIAWRGAREDPEFQWRQRVWMVLCALAFIGAGIRAVAPGPWTLLALPVLALSVYALARAAIRGAGDPLFDRFVDASPHTGLASAGPRALAMCAGCIAMFAILAYYAIGFAVA